MDNTLSIVVPLFNEAENAALLLERIHDALSAYPHPWELICIDDGSTDETLACLSRSAADYGPHVKIVALRRNFGQTAAMQAGFDHSRGDIVVTMDGDLQNDPRDIPRMVERLQAEDLDLLVGWRRDRNDPWLRRLFSRVANRLIARATGVHLHDYGCSLKVYRGNVIRDVNLIGEMHRFIPVWVAAVTQTSRIQEEVVTHHARQFGTSKYGFSRTYRVLLDLLSVLFFLRFLSRPAHFFGNFGLALGSLGGAGLVYLAVVKFVLGQNIGQRPLLMISILLVLVSIQLISTGLIGEIASRTYYASSGRKAYLVRERASRNLEDDDWRRPEAIPKKAATAQPVG